MPVNKTRPRVFGQPESVLENTLSVEATVPSNTFRDELPLLGENTYTSVGAEVHTTVKLKLPQTLYEEYVKTASMQDMSVEDVLQHRVVSCKNHNSLRGIWFSDSERAQLEQLLKKWPLETASQVLTLLSQAGNIDLDDLKICLTLPQRKVLNIRTRYGSSPKQVFEAMIRKEFQV